MAMIDQDALRRRGRELPDEEAGEPQQVALKELRSSDWNPRTIGSERFKNLCSSMQADPDFLRLRPILARADGSIYAGNMRFRAAQKLGYKTVWAVMQDVSEQLAQERAARDNNSWGEWDDQALGEMLAGLKEMGSDVGTLGFDTKALEALMDGGSGPPEQPEVDPPPAPVDVIVERWQVLAMCPSESSQRELIDELGNRGIECRALIT